MPAIFQSKNPIFDQCAVEFNRNANFDSNTVETNRSFSQKIFRLKYTRNKSKFHLRIISIKVHCDKQTLQSKSVIFYTEFYVPINFLCIPNSPSHNFVGLDYYLYFCFLYSMLVISLVHFIE